MTLRDDLLPAVWAIRSIPGQFGIRPHTVSLVTTTWTGVVTGEGLKTVTIIPVVEGNGQPPKVRWLKQETILLNGLDAGSCAIGPITPDFSGGGTALAALTGAATPQAATFHLLITGPQHPDGALYEVTTSSGDRALHYSLIAKPVSRYTAVAPGPTGDALLDGADVLTDAAGNPLIVVPDQLVDPDGDSLQDGGNDLTT